MESKTPIQQAIEKIKVRKLKYVEAFQGMTLSEKGQLVYDGVLMALDECIKEVESLLPAEKQWAKRVWEGGYNRLKGQIQTADKNRTAPHDFAAINPAPDFDTYYSQFEK